MRSKYIIGIDPDVDKSGFCLINRLEKKIVFLKSLTFFEMLNMLNAIDNADCVVYIEVTNTKHNWHLQNDSKRVAAAKGYSVGRNAQVANLIVEMCEYLNIEYRKVKPLKKFWHGSNRKITAKEFKHITGYEGSTNQEMRDAGLLAWVNSDLPIKIIR